MDDKPEVFKKRFKTQKATIFLLFETKFRNFICVLSVLQYLLKNRKMCKNFKDLQIFKNLSE